MSFRTVADQREACGICSLKHIGQARVLAKETRKGYAHYFWFALGHMAEAEDELLDELPHLAEYIRLRRKAWEVEPFEVPDFESIINHIARETGFDLDAEFEIRGGKETLYEQAAGVCGQPEEA